MVDRLINVAVTRAKGKLILVGNASYWNKRVNANNPAWDLIKYIKRKDETKKIESYELFKMLNKRTHSKIKFYTDEES